MDHCSLYCSSTTIESACNDKLVDIEEGENGTAFIKLRVTPTWQTSTRPTCPPWAATVTHYDQGRLLVDVDSLTATIHNYSQR